MNKKIFAVMIAMVLLASIMTVYGEISDLNLPAPPQPESKTAPSPPNTKTIVSGTRLLYIDSNKEISAPWPIINYISTEKANYDNIYADKHGVYFYKGGQAVKTMTWQGAKWTVKEGDKIERTYEFGKGGGIKKVYDKEGHVIISGIYDKELAISWSNALEIPSGFIAEFEEAIKQEDFKINIIKDGYGWSAGNKNGYYDTSLNTLTTITTDASGKEQTSYKTFLVSGGIVTMNSDGDVEVRGADGKLVESFSGKYGNGVYTDKDGRYEFNAGDSTLTDKTKRSTITYMHNGDVVYEAPNAKTIYHKNGDTTNGYFEDGKLLYSDRTNKEGWLVSRADNNGNEYREEYDGKIHVYEKNGKEIISPTTEQQKKADEYGSDLKLNKLLTGREAVSKFIGTYIMGLTDYRALSNALFKGKDYQKYQDDVDRFFARTYLGIDYWASEICRKEFHSSGNKGFAAIETPTGLVQFIGHVEAEKSAPIPKECPCAKDETCKGKICYKGNNMQVEFFYKITYGVTAPSDLKLTPQRKEGSAVSFSIQLSGEKQGWLFVKKGTDVPYFYELQNGQSQNAVSDKAVVFYSPTDYTGICIYFREKPEDALRGVVDKICNVIPQSQSSYLNWKASKSSGTGGTPAEENAPEAGPEINPEI